ncbi:MAG: STAS domain-containing protein [Bacteroidaceae bacterium]|nr:STAS domain-containing protein [Bacteroidaceae bacterium]
MTIKINKQESEATLALIGSLDTPASASAEQQIKPLMDGIIKSLDIDCGGLTYISSSGLRIMITLQKHFMRIGGRLTLHTLQPDIRDVFEMTGFINLFDIKD